MESKPKPSGTVASTTITPSIISLAILKVNWDKKRKDYVDNFVPIVAEAIRLSDHDVVSIPQLQQDIRAKFGLRRHTSRPASHGRVSDGRRRNLVARRAGYRRLVDAADARTLRASERRGDVARGSRAHRVHDRYKNRHSDEKRKARSEEDQRRKC